MFGEIVDGEMRLNEIEGMIDKWCMELPHKFPDIILDTYIIMPNHFHAIIVNAGTTVGADLCVCPNDHTLGEHTGSPLHVVIQWFKTMTTNEYIRGVKTLGRQPFNRRVWQRNYYEHVIRNEQSHQHIAGYIAGNPVNWLNDDLYDGENQHIE